jgi:hypothetical protein
MNRYRNIRAAPVGTERQPITLHERRLDLGMNLAVDAKELSPSASPDLLNIRFERRGIRQDFGESLLGDPAERKVLAIFEHKFIDTPATDPAGQFHRLIRVTRDAINRAVLEIWNASTDQWVADTITPSGVTIGPRYVKDLSIQNVVLLAVEGSPVLIRRENTILTPNGDDFPAGLTLTQQGHSAQATFTGTEPIVGNKFRTNFSVELTERGGNVVLVITVRARKGIELLGEKSFVFGDPEKLEHEFIEFVENLSTNDKVVLELVEASGLGPIRTAAFSDNTLDAPPDLHADKVNPRPAKTNIYTFSNFLVPESASPRTVNFYIEKGSGWSLEHTENYPAGEDLITSLEVEIPDFNTTGRFGLHGDVERTFLTTVSYSEDITGDEQFIVKPFNQAVDEDEEHGLSYVQDDGIELSLEPTEGPEALWLESFADRAVALVDGPDTQSLWWTASGRVDVWNVAEEGADQLLLLDTRNDPIDDLQCAAPLSNDTLALFRTRSIMRAFRTGQVSPAIGVQHWIENLGTESPFSRQVTPLGIAFLGHDRMVYILSETGIRPVGHEIHQEIVTHVTENLNLVDSAFDPVFQHYYLGTPRGASGVIRDIYILDIGRLIIGDDVVWRKRTTPVSGIQRFGIASEL